MVRTIANDFPVPWIFVQLKRCLTEREILATVDNPFIVTLYYCFQVNYFTLDARCTMLGSSPRSPLTETGARARTTSS